MTRAGSETADDPISAVIFDLDGTLVDSYEAITACFNHARAQLGFPPITEGEVRPMVGHGLEALMERAVGEDRMAEGVRLFRAHYDTICEARTRVLPGVVETLAELHRRGFLLGVATNKPVRFARRLLCALGLMPPIAAVRGPGGDIPAKPHPSMLSAVLADLGVKRHASVYVGDMGVDVETARRAGLRVWLVPTGSASRAEVAAAGADHVLERFDDLPALVSSSDWSLSARGRA